MHTLETLDDILGQWR